MAHEPHKGALAACSLGHIGLILSDKPEPVYYDPSNVGNMALAWTGIHLWPFELAGKPWSSRNPVVLPVAIWDDGQLVQYGDRCQR